MTRKKSSKKDAEISSEQIPVSMNGMDGFEENSMLEEENRILKNTIESLRNELERIRMPPLLVAEFSKKIGKEKAIINLKSNNSKFLVSISSKFKGELNPGDQVLIDKSNLTILEKLEETNGEFEAEKFVIIEKPKIKWGDIGGLKKEIEEVKEVIEMPLLYPEKFKKIGIEPPKGVLLHGPPGTGKTLIAKAVANETNATFIEIVGSELVQKFIGEGAKLVKEIFAMAKYRAPAIIFIDEIDAVAAKRMETGTSGEREVNRTFMQLLAEIDGFDNLGNVKIIGATNRIDILDHAVIRPGRLERLIEIGAPDKDGVKQILGIHTKGIKKEKIELEKLLKKMEGMSGAEIKAVCTEAGYFALRKNKPKVTQKDFEMAIEKVIKKEEENENYLKMFG